MNRDKKGALKWHKYIYPLIASDMAEEVSASVK